MNKKNICLVAHDHKKEQLLSWANTNKELLKKHNLSGTGTTSSLVRDKIGVEIKSYLSGPYGGDQEIGAAIANKEIDVLVFFWDPLEAQPHDPDVKALLRIAVLYDIPVAMNCSTANLILADL